MRREFSRSVKVAVVKRATRGGEVYCEECGVMCKSKWEIDHVRPDGLLGEATLENARLLCRPCHVEKTATDVAQIAKAKAREARALGLKGRSGFQSNRRREDRVLNKTLTKVVPRRAMFIDE